MKTQILDTPIIENVQDLLTTGESIVWKSEPQVSNTIPLLETGDSGIPGARLNVFGIVLFLFAWSIYTFIYSNAILGIFYFISSLTTFFLPQVLKKKRRQHTKYFITSERIIFKLWWYGKTTYHQIPFSELKNIIVTEDASRDDIGTIYFVVKNPQAINFTTHNFRNSERRHQPTFELVENVNEVAQLIRENFSKKV